MPAAGIRAWDQPFAATGLTRPAPGIPIGNPTTGGTGHLSRTALNAADITGRTDRYTCAAEPTNGVRIRPWVQL